MNQNTNLSLFTPEGCIIAIPLAPSPNFELGIQPNFLKVKNIFDRFRMDFPQPDGSIKETALMNSCLELVYREILPAENGKPEEIREIVFEKDFNQLVPKIFFDITEDHQSLIDHATVLNQWLGMFQFRGCLKNFRLQYDPELSLEYFIMLEESQSGLKSIPTPEIPEPEPDPATQQ